jgi:hypothetical protein
MFGLIAGGIAAQHIGARYLRKRHNATAIRRGESVGGLVIPEWHGFRRADSACLRLSITKNALRASIQLVAPGSSQLVARAISET